MSEWNLRLPILNASWRFSETSAVLTCTPRLYEIRLSACRIEIVEICGCFLALVSFICTVVTENLLGRNLGHRSVWYRCTLLGTVASATVDCLIVDLPSVFYFFNFLLINFVLEKKRKQIFHQKSKRTLSSLSQRQSSNQPWHMLLSQVKYIDSRQTHVPGYDRVNFLAPPLYAHLDGFEQLLIVFFLHMSLQKPNSWSYSSTARSCTFCSGRNRWSIWRRWIVGSRSTVGSAVSVRSAVEAQPFDGSINQ